MIIIRIYLLFLLFWMMVHIVNCCSRWFLWEPFARKHLKEPSHRNVQKFSANAIALLFGTLTSVFAWCILINKDWLWNRSQWNILAHDTGIEADVKFFYLLYAARYFSDALMLPLEIQKSDSWAFAIHHAATIGLRLGIPVIVGFDNATSLIRDGGIISIDARRGTVYSGLNVSLGDAVTSSSGS